MAKVVDIKFKKAGRSYAFDTNNIDLKVGDKVVIETVRGLELGEVIRDPYEDNKERSKVVRLATAEDISKFENLNKKKKEIWDITQKLIDKFKLEMKIVEVEFTLDGSKVIISYVCEGRVDFRELIKELVVTVKKRVELRQIGVRDQAKAIGGYGSCGKECCCSQYLNDFDKVSIKMAKTQGLSLNPTKISGVCGRLMCCLSYENDAYAEALKLMPKVNSKVQTQQGEGVVTFNNLLKQTVTVRFEKDNEIKIVELPLSEVNFKKPAQENQNANKNK